MTQEASRIVYPLLICFPVAFSTRRSPVRQPITPLRLFKRRRTAMLILWVFVLTAMDMVCMDKTIEAADPNVPINLVAGEPGLDEEDGTLFIALPIVNEGIATASNVQVQLITVASATRITPTAFPVALGDIGASQRPVLDASFTSSGLVPDQHYLLTVEGTYVLGVRPVRFVVKRDIRLPLPASGEDEARTGSAEPNVVSGAPFPPGVIVGPPEAEVNPAGPPIPTGPRRGSIMPPSPPAEVLPPTVLNNISLDRVPSSLQQVTNRLVFVRNTPFGTTQGAPPDSSGASSDDVVLASGNTYASLSTDGGRTFTQLDPTTIFPNQDAAGNLIDGGLCCDQIIHYAASINRFVWLMQFNRATRVGDKPGEPTGPNRLRLAVASPEAIINNITQMSAAWASYDLTSAMFGLGNDWMDYPDIAVGDNFLYISVDAVRAVGGSGLMVVRIPLSELENGGGTINFRYTDPDKSTSAYFMHIMQNPGNEVFWVGHLSDSKIQVFSWREDSTRYSWRDIRINTWPNRDFSSITPDGTTNWLTMGPYGGNILGATRRLGPGETDELVFAWTAGRGGDFPHPHIQFVGLDRSSFRKLYQFAIWNNDFAFAYPAFTTNANNELAASLAVGGPSLFPTHAVGFVEDGQYFFSSVSDGANVRNGDYYTVRSHFPNSKLLSAFGYGIRLIDPTMSTNCYIAPFCRFDPHYVLFGRASDVLADLAPVRVDQTFCNIIIAPPGLSLVVTVKNQGSSDAPASNTTVLFSSGEAFLLPTGPLSPGQSVDLPALSIPSGCFQPDCSFRITVDSSDQVDEFDEANNSVRGQCVG